MTLALQESRKEKKKAREMLSAIRDKMKPKAPMTVKARHEALEKSTPQTYFTSLRHQGLGALLMLVLDSKDLDIPGLEPGNSEEDLVIAAMVLLRIQ